MNLTLMKASPLLYSHTNVASVCEMEKLIVNKKKNDNYPDEIEPQTHRYEMTRTTECFLEKLNIVRPRESEASVWGPLWKC